MGNVGLRQAPSFAIGVITEAPQWGRVCKAFFGRSAASVVTILVTFTIGKMLALTTATRAVGAWVAHLGSTAATGISKFVAGDGKHVAPSRLDGAKFECGHVPIAMAQISFIFAEPGSSPVGKLQRQKARLGDVCPAGNGIVAHQHERLFLEWIEHSNPIESNLRSIPCVDAAATYILLYAIIGLADV